MLDQQLLEYSLLPGVLKNAFWNYCERSGAPIEKVRVGIDQSSRIDTPFKMGIDVRCLEVDALRRKCEGVFVAELRLIAKSQSWNDEKSRNENEAEDSGSPNAY